MSILRYLAVYFGFESGVNYSFSIIVWFCKSSTRMFYKVLCLFLVDIWLNNCTFHLKYFDNDTMQLLKYLVLNLLSIIDFLLYLLK